MVKIIKRFDVRLVNLDPTQWGEMKKTRPCLILSDDELNFHYLTVIVAPLTKTQTNFPTRIKSSFMETAGEIALDHLRAVDKTRLVKKLWTLDIPTCQEVCEVLQEMFAY